MYKVQCTKCKEIKNNNKKSFNSTTDDVQIHITMHEAMAVRKCDSETRYEIMLICIEL